MASTGSGAQVQSCPNCGHRVVTAGVEPFGKVNCPQCGHQLRVERVFENYLVVEPLGTGGMGSVYKARDTRLNRFVALKLLRKEFAGDAEFTAKLQDEARITASIKHPHVIEVYSVGEDHGQFYVVMELVDGGSLDDRIEDEKRVSEMEMLEVGIQVAKGLQAALKAGLIHRDIKPGNILFTDRHTAKIVDFGLALLAAAHAETEGEIWGTPYYVAPERLTNAKENFLSDLYSLGATLFHAVSGHPTFEDETQSAAELKKLKSNPPGLRTRLPEISEETAAVVDRMLRPNPADRQESYEELITELQAAHAAALAREEELRARWGWPRRIAVSLGILLLLGAIGFGLSVGWRHLPRRTAGSASEPGPTATPIVDLQKQLAEARRELEAGHYASADALFRELAQIDPAIAPAAELCAALQIWERGEFAQASAIFERFVKYQPPPQFAWLKETRTFAQERLDDYRLFTEWEKTRDSTRDLDVALEKIRVLSGKLKAKGGLAFRVADEEAKLVVQGKERAAKRAAEEENRAAEDKKHAATEAPRWQAALAAERKPLAAYRFDNAVAIMESTELEAKSLQAERDQELQRARWLAEWKAKLISDINQTGYGGAVTDVHGMRYDGPVRRATPDKLELKTRYGSVMTDWQNLAPAMLLKMSTAFIRPAVSDVPERQWLSAVFAAQTGQTAAANDLAKKAAEGKAEFRDLLPRYFPDAKK
ncbi:MAG: protein kinase [Chthoniobacterales bacterium]|nr:protein kinase [Chthoniobacterales bacterium]